MNAACLPVKLCEPRELNTQDQLCPVGKRCKHVLIET